MKQYGEIRSIEFTQGADKPFASKCIVSYEKREQAVNALFDLESHRYFEGAAVPMSIKLLDEKQSSAPNISQASIQEEKKDVKSEPEITITRPVQEHKVTYIEYISDNGTPYYYNTETKKTQWEVPLLNAIVYKHDSKPKIISASAVKNVTMPKFVLVLILLLYCRRKDLLGAMCLFIICRMIGMSKIFTLISRNSEIW